LPAGSHPARLQQRQATLIEPIKGLLPVKRLTEGLESTEFADCVLVELLNAVERLLADSFLVVGEEEATEVRTLEEVLALVLGLRHAQDVLVLTVVIFGLLNEFAFHLVRTVFRRVGCVTDVNGFACADLAGFL
jgi:hypothetical protein